MKTGNPSSGERRGAFQRLLKKREQAEHGRGREQRQSLEGLRLAALMKQMQALQAIQGLQELAPKKGGQQGRLQIAADPEERARQRQWLEYKADWLQAVLEDTVAELESMDRFEADLASMQAAPRSAAGNAGGKGSPGGEGVPGT